MTSQILKFKDKIQLLRDIHKRMMTEIGEETVREDKIIGHSSGDFSASSGTYSISFMVVKEHDNQTRTLSTVICQMYIHYIQVKLDCWLATNENNYVESFSYTKDVTPENVEEQFRNMFFAVYDSKNLE